MKLSIEQLDIITDVLDTIDSGNPPPALSGRIGRFLRQYQRGQDAVTEALLSSGVPRRADLAVSGELLGKVTLHVLSSVKRTINDGLLGEVADVICVSEELGMVGKLVLWTKSISANAAYNLITRQGSSIRMAGDYRWTPLTKITAGTSEVSAIQPEPWKTSRCLRAVADDLDRPPHALEYRLDYRLGPPGVKFFRSVTASFDGSHWWALPALAEPKPLTLEATASEAIPEMIGSGEVFIMFVYREPWSEGWTLLGSLPITAEEAVAHSVEWADFQCELQRRKLDPSIVAGIRRSLRALGVEARGIGEPNLRRRLLPVVRDTLNRIRGTAGS